MTLSSFYYLTRNHIWYHLGYELFNSSRGKRIVTVQKVNGKQHRSNLNRQFDYALDDPGWLRVIDYPELFI